MRNKFMTSCGHIINIENIKEDDIILEDIAHHLAKIQRFNGTLPIGSSYTVGEHCINLARIHKLYPMSSLARRMFLLHDASEAFLSDVVSPMKLLLPDYKALEHEIQMLINKRFLGVSTTIDDFQYLKELDSRIVIDEVMHLMPERVPAYTQITGHNPLHCHIEYNNHPSTIKACYLKLAKELDIQ